MNDLLLLLASLFFGGACLALVLVSVSRQRVSPVPATTWRLILSRGSVLTAARMAGCITALTSLMNAKDAPCSVEFRAKEGQIHLFIRVPSSLEAILPTQLSAWLPEVRLERMTEEPEGSFEVVPLTVAVAHVPTVPRQSEAEPDALLGFLSVFTEMKPEAGFRMSWRASRHPLSGLLAFGHEPRRQAGERFNLYRLFVSFGRFLWQGLSSASSANSHIARIDPHTDALPEEKNEMLLPVQLLLWVRKSTTSNARLLTQPFVAALQTNFSTLSGWKLKASGRIRRMTSPPQSLTEFMGPTVPLTPSQIGQLFHVPDPLPSFFHQEISRRRVPHLPSLETLDTPSARPIGLAFTPGGSVPFGLGLEERRHHLYVTGKTGTGKSTLLSTLAMHDLTAGHGFGLIDPHGDLAEHLLTFIPPARYDDVLYFNPADREFPIPFNLLAGSTAETRPLVASGLLTTFKKLYGEFWGPRLEHILRNALLALLELPTPSLLLLPRLLTDPGFRHQVVARLRDPVVRAFFTDEFERYDPRWRAEAISPILNKVGQFLTSPLLRPILGSRRSGFDLRSVIDDGLIFIANLSTGRIGEDNSDLLGSLIVTGFQLAAMSRADQPETNRRDFFLLIDEFQHFATEAFAGLLSEARKYRLSLTLSNQFFDQLPPATAGAVLGNVGSLFVFRLGSTDAHRFAQELAPAFDNHDLIHLPNHQFCARLLRNGELIPPFSGATHPSVAGNADPQIVIERSRQRWARPRTDLEAELAPLWPGR